MALGEGNIFGLFLGGGSFVGISYALIRLFVAHKLNTRENTRYCLADMGDVPAIPEGMGCSTGTEGGRGGRDTAEHRTHTRVRTNDVRTRHGSGL